MGAWVWRDEDGRLRCRRSPGGTEWYVKLQQGGVFELWDSPDAAAAAEAPAPARARGAAADPGPDEGAASISGESEAVGRVRVGRIDPETGGAIIKFLLRERRSAGSTE